MAVQDPFSLMPANWQDEISNQIGSMGLNQALIENRNYLASLGGNLSDADMALQQWINSQSGLSTARDEVSLQPVNGWDSIGNYRNEPSFGGGLGPMQSGTAGNFDFGGSTTPSGNWGGIPGSINPFSYDPSVVGSGVGPIPVNTDPNVVGATSPPGTDYAKSGLYGNDIFGNEAPVTSVPGGGGQGFGLPLPIIVPGLSWPAAIGATIALNPNGIDIFGGGGSPSQVVNQAGNAVMNPIDTAATAAGTIAAGDMIRAGPTAPNQPTSSNPPIAWPSPVQSNAGSTPVIYPTATGPAITNPTAEPSGGNPTPPVVLDTPIQNPTIPLTREQIYGDAAQDPLFGVGPSPVIASTGTPPPPKATDTPIQNPVAPLTREQIYGDAASDPLFGTGPAPVISTPPPRPPDNPPSGGGSTVVPTPPPPPPVNPPPKPPDAPSGGGGSGVVPVPPPVTPPPRPPDAPSGGGGSGVVPVPQPATPPPNDTPSGGNSGVVPSGGGSTGGGGGGPFPVIVPIPTNSGNTTPMATPADRNLYQEWLNSTQSIGSLAPDIFSNYARYSGSQGQSDIGNYSGLLSQLGATNQMLTDQANQQTLGSNRALRGSNVQDVQTYAPQLQALIDQLNPNKKAALGSAQAASAPIGVNQYQQGLGNTFAGGPQYQQVAAGENPLLGFAAGQAQANGYSPLGADLQRQAQEQLALGGSLSQQDTRNAQQAAREAWAARGLVNSNGAVGAEILNQDALSRQRLAERQAFAQNVGALGQQQQGINQNYTLGVLGAGGQQVGQNLQGQMANQQAGLNAQQLYQGLGTSLTATDYARQQQNAAIAAQNAALQASTAYDPTALLFGTNTQNQGMNTNLFNQGVGFSSGAYGNQYLQGLMNPQNAYSNDVFGSNFNAANARLIAEGNNAAAIQGANTAQSGQIASGLLGLVGRLGGAYIGSGSCWVARSVYGVENPKWLAFRFWLLNRAPAWFRKMYLRYGASFASWLDRHPSLKPAIRSFMDARIATLNRGY